ncbi:MAG TPA: hypothetical protein PK156_37850 [Polyangium sp.]|nr:hypothetical protein [Polyangium sp.]
MSSASEREDDESGSAGPDAADTPGEEELDGPLRRLDHILRALPSTELTALVRRLGIRIDPQKRIDPPSQVARALVGIPDVRDPSRLQPSSRELLYRVAEAGGALVVPSLPAGLEPLVARGILYARKIDAGIELVLPIAFLVQIKPWEGEDPRSLRALLSQASFETASAVAAHYLGRPATPPIVLSLEVAWQQLSDPERLQSEVARLAPAEKRLLEAIDAVGGEVETHELLDLEREPMRLRGASGVTASRRGAGFALERRAFLVPIHPNRHVIPTEIGQIVGAERRKAREARRAQIRSFVLEEDHAPRRARFALDPASLAMGLAFAMREATNDSRSVSEVRVGVGTPRSLIVRFAQRFGRDVETVALSVALSRAIGLWEPSSASIVTPPGSFSIRELTRVLFNTWRRGGAWDEARPEREVLRTATEGRESSPIGGLREMVLDALQELGEGRWVPWSSLRGYLAADDRIGGVERLVRRWAERMGIEAIDTTEIIRRIALESLPALGILDLGGEGELDDGVTLRLTSRGRALLAGTDPPTDSSSSQFVDTYTLQIHPATRVAHALALASFAEVSRIGDKVDVVIASAAVARALSAGLESETLRARIEAVALIPDNIAQMLDQASVVLGRATYVQVSGFLWIEDQEVRELLRTRRPVADMFVDPSPPAGLLIGPDVDLERLVRRCRALGVEIEADGALIRARSMSPLPGAPETARPASATRPRSRTPSTRTSRS